MKYRIVQYLQPWEIDDFERQINVMILSSYHIDKTDDIIWDVTLNISDQVVDWDESRIPKQFILNKFNYLKKLVNQYYIAEFDTDDTIQGCTDKRRVCYCKKQDFIIWLDSDVYFSHLTLPYLVISSKQITNQCFIISPQIIKYWDSSWDCIVYEPFLNQPNNHRDFFDAYSINQLIQTDQITVRLNHTIKFGGGWFNLFSNSIFEKIPLPIELGSYASDDTYIMLCSDKHKIPQYLLNGIFVTEIGNRYLDGKNYLKDMCSIKIKDRNRISSDEFNKLITDFYNK
jgi:hypothetical protein